MVRDSSALLLLHFSALAGGAVVTHRQVGKPVVREVPTSRETPWVVDFVVTEVFVPLGVWLVLRLPRFRRCGIVCLSTLVIVARGRSRVGGGRGGISDSGARAAFSSAAGFGRARPRGLADTGRAKVPHDVTEARR